MSYIGNEPTTAQFPIDLFNGDGSTTDFTLTQAPGSASAIDVHVGTVYQVPSSGYTVSGTTIAFTSAPPTGTNNIVVVHKGVQVQIPTPADGTVTLAKTSGSLITSGTAQATTSGTEIDFTSIPSWVKKITVMLSGTSTSGTSSYILQLGDSGGIEATSYVGSNSRQGSGGNIQTLMSTGFLLNGAVGAAFTYYGAATLVLLDSSTNTWICTSHLAETTTTTADSIAAGSKSLSGTLDRVRFTTVGGTDTFDAGSINILYE